MVTINGEEIRSLKDATSLSTTDNLVVNQVGQAGRHSVLKTTLGQLLSFIADNYATIISSALSDALLRNTTPFYPSCAQSGTLNVNSEIGALYFTTPMDLDAVTIYLKNPVTGNNAEFMTLVVYNLDTQQAVSSELIKLNKYTKKLHKLFSEPITLQANTFYGFKVMYLVSADDVTDINIISHIKLK